MQWVHDEDGRLKDRVVLAVVLGALAIGLLLYNVVPYGSGTARAAAPARLTTGATVGAATDPVATGTPPAPAVPVGGSPFRSGVATTAAAALVRETLGTDDVDGLDTGAGPSSAPRTPAAPVAECPTAAASDAYESVADPVAEALGQRVPRDNLRLLVEIAAGCSDDTPTTPLLGLALDLARLLPDTGIAPLDLSAIPPVAAPELPAPVIDALAPLNEQIMEACANVGLLGVIVAVVPSTAKLPVNGSELADLLVPAQSLCAQFEG